MPGAVLSARPIAICHAAALYGPLEPTANSKVRARARLDGMVQLQLQLRSRATSGASLAPRAFSLGALVSAHLAISARMQNVLYSRGNPCRLSLSPSDLSAQSERSWTHQLLRELALCVESKCTMSDVHVGKCKKPFPLNKFMRFTNA